MKEEFRIIPNFRGRYEISSQMRIRSRVQSRPKIMKPLFDRHNYLYARLYDNEGKAHNLRLAELWSQIFSDYLTPPKTETEKEEYNPFKQPMTTYNPFNEIDNENSRQD